MEFPQVQTSMCIWQANAGLFAFGREVTRRILAGEYSKEEPGCADPKRIEEIRRALE